MAMEKERKDYKKADQDEDKEPDNASGGEDESSTEKEGDDRHLHDDQKAPTYPSQG
jgi:hypothetical protein